MSSQAELQSLLRFLTSEAKLSLGTALAAVKGLQALNLATPAAIASSDVATLTPIFPDDAKRVLNAAKRLSKKGSNAESSQPARKKRRLSPDETSHDPKDESSKLESSLSLPEPVTDLDTISNATLYTNRAPLMLAFVLCMLKYTMPRQPLSSRLSLAQAVVSQGAQKKAVHLGFGKASDQAESQGWGEGQPTMNLLGNEIRLARRHGYPLQTLSSETNSEEKQPSDTENEESALWALDLEALKNSNTVFVSGAGANTSPLPIYAPQGARAYLLKSFATVEGSKARVDVASSKSPAKKPKVDVNEKTRNLSLLLGALDLLFQSWASNLSAKDLERRTWSWYVAVRPQVEHGPAGWGGKGEVQLRRLLDLRRPDLNTT